MNTIQAAAMGVARSKMNSTMMVKFNSSTEKGINQRANMNKSTLLPQTVTHQNHPQNSRNPAMKVNLNFENTNNDQHMQNNSLEHLNRSMNMHQTTAFSQNVSYQQSPPNMRARQLQNQTNTQQKIGSMLEKPSNKGLGMKMASHSKPGLYVNGQSHLQTLNTGGTQGSLMLPMAPGAQQSNTGQTTGKNWNSQSLGHTMTHAQVNAKNKDRYMAMQQQNRDAHVGINPAIKQQFFIGSQNTQFQNINSSALSQTGNPQQQLQSVDMMQNHLSMIHQSPTLSPTSQNHLMTQAGQPYMQYTQQPQNSRKIKTLNVNQ